MLCQRCGSCCVNMFVVVPIVIGGQVRACAKPEGMRCPNLLSGDDGKLSCLVHDLPEYKGSPCWTYGNSHVDPDYYHKRGKPCLVGRMWIDNRGGFPVPEYTNDSLESLSHWLGEPDESY
jgi:hypothetical protein